LACAATVLALAPAALADGSVQPVTVSPDPTFGKPITYTVSGATPGPNPYPGYSSYQVMFGVRPVSDAPCGQYDYDANPVHDPFNDPVNQVWDVTNADGPFTRSYSPAPERAGPLLPGIYRACAWLWNSQADTGQEDHGLIAMSQSMLTVREPRFAISLHLAGRLRLQPYRRFHDPHYTPLTAHITAEVGRQRTLLVTVQPPGVRRCPHDVTKSRYYTELPVPPLRISGRLNNDAGLSLRDGGPFTYRLGVALYNWARPGRSLLCAGVYDNYDDSAPANEEAAAQTWINVRR
jgi:hypothetical protein